MAVQFLRGEMFSFQPISRQGRMTRPSIDAVIAEAARDPARPEGYRHIPVDRILAPIMLTDLSFGDVRDQAWTAAKTGLEESGRRFRSTGNALFATVPSFPRLVDHYGYPRPLLAEMIRAGVAGERVEDPDVEAFVDWSRRTVDWAVEELGGPVAACAHLDEEAAHLHIMRPLQIDPETGIASLSFWRPERAVQCVRRRARAAGQKPTGKEVVGAFQLAARVVAQDYNMAVGVHFGHELASETPRKRRSYQSHRAMTEADRQAAVAAAEAAAKTESERAQRAERELSEIRVRAETAEAEARSLADRLAAADAEIGRLREKLRAVLDRARSWFGALRGEPAAVRSVAEQPTISESKIDTALGVSRDELQRRRVSAI
jgi:hypothetical protein